MCLPSPVCSVFISTGSCEPSSGQGSAQLASLDLTHWWVFLSYFLPKSQWSIYHTRLGLHLKYFVQSPGSGKRSPLVHGSTLSQGSLVVDDWIAGACG